jgi:2-polyprenyl-3-methyl-5-hydroxy-6-metoxy-1,4-benzoquinol methylase
MSNVTNADVIASWSNAPRELMEAFPEEGDFLRRYLLNPTIFRLLGPVEGRKILDAGCGQGYLTRLLARRGARATGLEPAESLFRYAIEREQEEGLGIEYIQADLSTFRERAGEFDAVVASMVLMDIPDYRPAVQSCLEALRSGGSFVFSLAHPCFEESEGEYAAKGYVEVREYLAEYHIEQQFGRKHHRPLSHYFNTVIQCGGVIRELVEPKLDPAHAELEPGHERNLHVPSFIVVRAEGP